MHKDSRYSKYIKQYFDSIRNSEQHPLLRTYKRFKTEARCEPYLLIPLHYEYRQAISRIRASSHHLGIETGRQTKPHPTPLNRRTCPHCPGDILDDEFHFILKCKNNSNERNALFSKLPLHITSLLDEDLFIFLFNNNDETYIRAFGKFLTDSFITRQPPDNGLISSTNNSTSTPVNNYINN